MLSLALSTASFSGAEAERASVRLYCLPSPPDDRMARERISIVVSTRAHSNFEVSTADELMESRRRKKSALGKRESLEDEYLIREWIEFAA